MGTMTYYVVLAFRRSEENGDIVAGDPKEGRSAEQAIRMAGTLAVAEGNCGAIAFSRTGDPDARHTTSEPRASLLTKD
jgi:hypothetical protein